MKDTVCRTLNDAAAEAHAPSVNADEARLPGWALRAGGRVGRSIASTIIGGAIFAFVGLWLTEQIEGPARVFGENVAWGGAAAWLFGCAWFAVHCRARRGWLGVLAGANLSAFAAAWVLLRFSTQSLPEGVRTWVEHAVALIPVVGASIDPHLLLARAVKLLVSLIFALQAHRLSTFCRSVQRPA